MCLGQKLSERSLQHYKAKGKKCGYIRVWKWVYDGYKKHTNQYVSFVEYHSYESGFAHARKEEWIANDDYLIHAYRTPTYTQMSWEKGECVLVELLVKPEWIVAISENCLTTKAIVMPEYPKRKVTVREFREAIKDKKVKVYGWEK